MRAVRAVLIAVVVLVSAVASAQDWAFAADEYSRAIVPADSIVISLGTSRVPTKNTFFHQVDEAGVVIQVTVTADVTQNNEKTQKSAVFPFAFRAPVADKNARLASLPFQGTPVKSLPLTAQNVRYTNVTFDLTMLRLDQPTLWTKIAQRLIGIAKTAAIPAAPFSGVATYALDFGNGVLTDVVGDVGKEQKRALGSRSLNFNVARPVRTGTYLLILDDDLKGDGYADPNRLSEVCLIREVGAGDTIKVGRKQTGAIDIDSAGCLEGILSPTDEPVRAHRARDVDEGWVGGEHQECDRAGQACALPDGEPRTRRVPRDVRTGVVAERRLWTAASPSLTSGSRSGCSCITGRRCCSPRSYLPSCPA